MYGQCGRPRTPVCDDKCFCAARSGKLFDLLNDRRSLAAREVGHCLSSYFPAFHRGTAAIASDGRQKKPHKRLGLSAHRHRGG